LPTEIFGQRQLYFFGCDKKRSRGKKTKSFFKSFRIFAKKKSSVCKNSYVITNNSTGNKSFRRPKVVLCVLFCGFGISLQEQLFFQLIRLGVNCRQVKPSKSANSSFTNCFIAKPLNLLLRI
jgi:hypothetical protein